MLQVALTQLRRTAGAGGARTEFTRANRRLHASVIVSPDLSANSLIELIAHELEHVIEQLDGVQLTGREQKGVFRDANHAFETARAAHIGQQVASEVRRSIHRTALQRDSGPILTGVSAISGDGAFVGFESLANLVPGDTNSSSLSDIYVLDVRSGRIELISMGVDGSPANGSSSTPSLSSDGRYVVFDTIASNLGLDKVPDCVTVFLRDRLAGTSRAVVRAFGDPSRVLCGSRPAVSNDGKLIAFESTSVDLVDGIDENGPGMDVYVTDVIAGTTSRVSVDNQGQQQPVGASSRASISGDGRYVAFTSTACIDRPRRATQGPVHPPCSRQVYVHDRVTARTRPVRAVGGNWPDAPTFGAAISAEGRYVAFTSTATNIVTSGVSDRSQVYLYDTELEKSELVSRTPLRRPGNGDSSRAAVGAAGRFVVFQSAASDLTCSVRCTPGERDDNLVTDVFVLDRQTSSMQRLSQGPGGALWWTSSIGPALDAAGRVFAFSSRHPTGPEDDGADFDLFVVKR
jgi:Tol biopolymer transport system component